MTAEEKAVRKEEKINENVRKFSSKYWTLGGQECTDVSFTLDHIHKPHSRSKRYKLYLLKFSTTNDFSSNESLC